MESSDYEHLSVRKSACIPLCFGVFICLTNSYLIYLFDNEVLELYKSVTKSSEPIDDIQFTRPSFFIIPSHVQVSLRTTAGFFYSYIIPGLY